MARIAIKPVNREHQLTGIELADAIDIFGEDNVTEHYGTVIVSGVSLGKLRSQLRDAGHSAQQAQ